METLISLMINVFLYTFRRSLVGLTAVSVGLFLISVLIIYTIEAFGGIAEFQRLFELMPDSILALFHAQGGFGTTPTSYIAGDYRHPIYLITGFSFGIAFASGAISREIERGTILMYLASPIERWQYVLAKIGVLVIGTAIIAFSIWLGSFVGAELYGLPKGEIDNMLLVFAQINMWSLMLAFGGITLLISAYISDGGLTIAWAAGISIVMYFVDFLSLIWSVAEPLGPLSLFHYFDPVGIARDAVFPWFEFLILMGVSALSMLLALYVFQKRDISN